MRSVANVNKGLLLLFCSSVNLLRGLPFVNQRIKLRPAFGAIYPGQCGLIELPGAEQFGYQPEVHQPDVVELPGNECQFVVQLLDESFGGAGVRFRLQ